MSLKKDNILWERAKSVANSQNKSSDWIFIIDIYHYLGGNKKSLYIVINDIKYLVVGKFSSNQDLLIDVNNVDKGYVIKPSEETKVSKKSFVDFDNSSDMIVINKPKDIDGISYSGFSFSNSNKLNIYTFKGVNT